MKRMGGGVEGWARGRVGRRKGVARRRGRVRRGRMRKFELPVTLALDLDKPLVLSQPNTDKCGFIRIPLQSLV
jgi:hypothetical protein